MSITKEHIKAYLEMYESLQQSIEQAGGSGSGFRVSRLNNITALELIQHLATNGIRFYCERFPPGEKK